MITTLLKHEWLRTFGLLGTIIGAAPLVVGAGILLTATGWPVISTVGMMLAVLAIGGLVPVVQLTLTVHYWRSSYSRTGYFTHSLPIRGSKIYTAKLTWAVIVTLITTLVAFGLGLLFWPVAADQFDAERNPFSVLGQLWNTITEVSSPMSLTIGAVMALVLLVIWPVHYFFAASIGSETPLNRYGLGGPVLVYVGLYLVMQVVAFAGLFAIPWGIGIANGNLGVVPFNLFKEFTIGVSTTNDIMPLGFLPAIALITLVCLVRTLYSWNRKVSLV